MDCFDMSLKVLTPSPACPPHLQILPLTARPWMSTGKTLLWLGQTARKHTPTQSSAEPCPQRQRRGKVRIQLRLHRLHPLLSRSLPATQMLTPEWRADFDLRVIETDVWVFLPYNYLWSLFTTFLFDQLSLGWLGPLTVRMETFFFNLTDGWLNLYSINTKQGSKAITETKIFG